MSEDREKPRPEPWEVRPDLLSPSAKAFRTPRLDADRSATVFTPLRAPEQRSEAPAERSGAQRGLAPDRGAGAHRGTAGTEIEGGDFVRSLRQEVRRELLPGDTPMLAYRCAQCNRWCINPAEHRLARSRVCLDCYVQYLDGVRS